MSPVYVFAPWRSRGCFNSQGEDEVEDVLELHGWKESERRWPAEVYRKKTGLIELCGAQLWPDVISHDGTPIKGGAASELMESSRDIYKMYFPKLQFVTACAGSYVCLVMGGACLSWLEPLTSWYQGHDSEVLMSEDQVSLVVSLVEVGGFIAPVPTGMLMDRIGRKLSMLLTGVVGLTGFLLAIFTRSVWALYVARILSGTALGAASTVAPVYIAEISPPNIRGALAGQLTFMFFTGQLLAYASGHYLEYTAFLWVCAACPLALIGLVLASPESPTYLLKTGQPERALEAARRLRVTFQQAEFDAARAAIEKEDVTGSGWKTLIQPGPFKILMVLQLLSFVSHVNGLPTLSLYATKTFGGREWLTMVMGGILAGASFFAAFLTDNVGRRPLLVTSLAGSALATAILTAYFYSDILWLLYLGIILFCVISSLGITPLIMTLQGELFPASTRAIASGISELTLAFASFLSLITYLPISNAFGIGVNFIAYTVISLLGLFSVIAFLPETANINIDVDNC